MVLNSLLLRSALDGTFESVHEHVVVLFYVHLLIDVNRLAFPVFESMAVLFRIHVHLLREKQSSKQSLPLQEHVILVRIFVVIRVLDGQDVISEAWDHEKLLIKRVHVANATEVLYSNTSCCALFVLIQFDTPVARFVRTPAWILVKFLHVVQNVKQIWDGVCAQGLQQGEGCLSSRDALALWSVLLPVRDLKEAVVDEILGEGTSNLLLELWISLQ